jgi:ATP-dependent DNA helicase DinG
MRERAASASLVVVNHHLLCADASVRQGAFGEVIPECDLAIIDEAHQLEDVVTQYFGVSVSTYRIDEFVRDASRAVGSVADTEGRFAVALTDGLRDVQATGRAWLDLARVELRRGGNGGDRVIMTTEVAARSRLRAHSSASRSIGWDPSSGGARRSPATSRAWSREARARR